jgi:hypothetical protein
VSQRTGFDCMWTACCGFEVTLKLTAHLHRVWPPCHPSPTL